MMMGPPPGMRGPSDSLRQKMKVPPPKGIKDIPRYFKQLLGGFFSRLFYIYGLVWETRPWILFTMLLMSVLRGTLPIISALISKRLINSLVTAATGTLEGGFRVILVLLVAQFVFMFISHMISSVDTFITRIAGELVSNHIKVKIMTKARDLDLSSFDRPEFFEKLENANQEAGRRPIQILSSSFNFMSSCISTVSFIIFLAAVSVWAPIGVALLSVPTAVVNFIYRRKNVMYMRFRSKDRRQMEYFSGLLVNKDMAKEVRMLDLGDTLIGKFKSVFTRYFAGLRKLILGESAWTMSLQVLGTAVNCALFLWIAFMVWQGELTVGDYTLYTGALTSIASGVTSLISTTASIYEGTLFIDNMIVFMKEPALVRRLGSGGHAIARRTGHTIEFRNVCFSYPGTTREVLSDVSFTLDPGETAVLVGLNGAGKTTLLKLLMRLYDPTSGEILLDGTDVREYEVKDYYDMFGIIFQDFGKYAVSVRENIEFGEINSEHTDARVKNAAVQSNADEFIEHLPDKFDTPLMRMFEQNGIELSIGQWQKLAIARAFYSDSDVLILDEPTASLDAIAEQEIFNQFDRLRTGKTTIFVSHRLSSATTASKIIVLKDGRVQEQGTHRELMRSGGEYSRLFTVQASRYIDSENNQK